MTGRPHAKNRSVVYLKRFDLGRATANLGQVDHAGAGRVVATTPGLGGPPRGSVENWVADTWQVLLSVDRPGRHDRFTDLGGDSLSAMEFSRLLATQFGLSMSLDRFATRSTIAALSADFQSGGGEQRQAIVTLRSDGDGPLCLMVPGRGGHAWAFSSLADALTGPADVLALSLMDLSVGTARDMRHRIRSTALAAVRDAAAAGRPIVVAGYSFGALIAADLACWLADHSVPVAHLCLLDPKRLHSSGPGWSPRAAVIAALRQWSPRTYRAVREWRHPDAGRSLAAQRLEDDIDAVARMLSKAYLDDSTRLPEIPISWLSSCEMATLHKGASTIFGTSISEIDKTVLGLDLDHLEIMRKPGVSHVANWLDSRLFGDGNAPESASLA